MNRIVSMANTQCYGRHSRYYSYNIFVKIIDTIMVYGRPPTHADGNPINMD